MRVRRLFAFVLGLLAAGFALSRVACDDRDDVAPAAPAGMVYVPGGVTDIGSSDGPPEERPVFRAKVAPFFMDVHPVTVAQFGEFVAATGYRTQAEQYGDGGVYDVATGDWRLVRGAYWRQPLGPAGPAAVADHPVTQVSWHDAVAYASWAGKRLPTEVEWEHAARGARNRRAAYAWGDSLVSGGQHHANTWQGTFPNGNTGADGHHYTSPVGAFGRTALGLSDMGGNVWEWTADWFAPYPEQSAGAGAGYTEKAQRGGSFLCQRDVCHGYRVSARSHSSPETPLFHVGFRLVQDVNAP